MRRSRRKKTEALDAVASGNELTIVLNLIYTLHPDLELLPLSVVSFGPILLATSEDLVLVLDPGTRDLYVLRRPVSLPTVRQLQDTRTAVAAMSGSQPPPAPAGSIPGYVVAPHSRKGEAYASAPGTGAPPPPEVLAGIIQQLMGRAGGPAGVVAPDPERVTTGWGRPAR